MFTRAVLVSLNIEDRGRLRALIAFDGSDVKPVQRDYEFDGRGLSDAFLVDAANAALDELNQRDAFLAKLTIGSVLVER
jgi:hypothetical protein